MGKTIRNDFFKMLLGGLFPVLLNALFLPLIWVMVYGALDYVYYLQALFLFISQSLSVYACGYPLYFAVKKINKTK